MLMGLSDRFSADDGRVSIHECAHDDDEEYGIDVDDEDPSNERTLATDHFSDGDYDDADDWEWSMRRDWVPAPGKARQA